MDENYHQNAPPGDLLDQRLDKPPGVTPNQDFVLQAFERYERPLTAYALRFYGGARGNLAAARDAVQFTFLQLCRQSPSDVQDKLAAWLYTVCRNRILDDRAKQKLGQAALQALGDIQVACSSRGLDPAACYQRSDLLQRIPAVLETLGETEREVVQLWAQGLPPREIAAVLDRRPGTIRVQLHRGIKSMQQHPEVQRWLERATSQSSDSVEQIS